MSVFGREEGCRQEAVLSCVIRVLAEIVLPYHAEPSGDCRGSSSVISHTLP